MQIVLKNSSKKQLTNIKNTARFKSERHNDFTEEINEIALSSNDDKKCNQLFWKKHMHMQSIKIQYVTNQSLNVTIEQSNKMF